MIILYHSDDKVVKASGIEGVDGMSVTEGLLHAAKNSTPENIAWCDQRLEAFLDMEKLPKLMHHKRLMYSFSTSKQNYLGPEIGFCEEGSPFVPVKFDVCYPTWQMSADVGLVNSETLNAFAPYLNADDDLGYLLNSFAKRAMGCGLLCYSNPELLKIGYPEIKSRKAGAIGQFKFVKQHYRSRWAFLLLIDMMLYKSSFPIVAYLSTFLQSRLNNPDNVFSGIPIESSKKIVDTGSIDVIVPTIGRKEHCHNMLRDLAAQTHLPSRVIVVEQNPDPSSESELDFLESEQWPFEIDHVFTHRTGACNARNVALDRTKSEFVFLADDDIRLKGNVLGETIGYFKKLGNDILQIAGPQPGEAVTETEIVQNPVLASGLLFAKRECFDGVRFGDGFEFGYGEDKDFGFRLRNKGFDILLVPSVQVLHLKAPIGGFRFKTKHAWSGDAIQPKPSPTVMLHLRRNTTPEQVQGYKTVYFVKNWTMWSKNPITAYNRFKRQWNRSVFWADELNTK